MITFFYILNLHRRVCHDYGEKHSKTRIMSTINCKTMCAMALIENVNDETFIVKRWLNILG